MSCFGSPPINAIAYNCELPFLPLRKYTVLPSFDTAGELTFQPSGVNRLGGTMSRVRRLRIHNDVEALVTSGFIWRLANTATLPSGVSAGEE